MTTEEIQKRLDDIRASSGDSEIAHGMDDRLRADFIKYIATFDSLPSLAAKARMILTTDDMQFERWTA